MNITMIHTSQVSVDDLNNLVREYVPNANVTNIIDDSLLREVKENNGITDAIVKRMTTYVKVAEENGADLIFNQCSSVGEAFDKAIQDINVMTLKIDEPMAEQAVLLGQKIAVVATVKSTIKPSCELVKSVAKKHNRQVEIDTVYVEGALDILMKENDLDRHNKLVLEAIKEAEKHNDVIVLAQGSMYVLKDKLVQFNKPVLTSPERAIKTIAKMVGESND